MVLQLASIEAISKIISNPSWDLLVILFFLIFGLFYGIVAGFKKLIAVLFSTYISFLLFINFSYLDFFTKDRKILEVFLFRGAVFLTLIVLLAILLTKTVFNSSRKKEKWWQVIVLSFLETGLFISALFQLLPSKNLFPFSPVIKTVFASDGVFFWWLTLPLVVLFFITKKD